MKILFEDYMKNLSQKEIAYQGINSNISGSEILSIFKNTGKKCLLLESEHINLL